MCYCLTIGHPRSRSKSDMATTRLLVTCEIRHSSSSSLPSSADGILDILYEPQPSDCYGTIGLERHMATFRV